MPEPTYPCPPGALRTLRSRRFFHEPVVCEIIRLIPGTCCYLVDMQSGSLEAYAHEDELSIPKKGESGWHEGIDYDD
jgi:hypothetical protein